ncbi:Crp/Fnr family transcriptional regulator [Nonomuraea sp. NPDC050547]|uniref:Crp/Fnr family transcriptional regulator n=1 Tax=Nonomuraea sp. NPDC050547 TaxID=3364368 RepID=UPI0037A55BC7
MSSPLWNTLISQGTHRRFQPGETLVREGERSEQVLFIVEGFVTIGMHDSSGRYALLDLRGPGEFIGEMAAIDGQAVRQVTVTAGTELRAVLIPGIGFRRVLSMEPELGFILTRALGSRLDWANRRRLDAASVDVETRIARLLLALAERYEFLRNLPLTQAGIASMAATSVVAAQRVLRRFRSLGLVRTGYRTLEIVDPVGLQRVAEPD